MSTIKWKYDWDKYIKYLQKGFIQQVSTGKNKHSIYSGI